MDERNYGVIDLPLSPTDWLAGSIPYVDRQADWSQFLPQDEPQSQGFDTMACVSFSALNVIETQLSWYLASAGLPEAHKTYLQGVSVNGRVNFSDRFLAKASGTTVRGNALTIVADTIRHMGLVKETSWPSDWDNWDDYYAPIPGNILSEARQFTDLWNVEYEVVWSSNDQMNLDTLNYHLKQAPLQIATRVCPGWGGGTIPKCDPYPTQHATELYGVDSAYQIYDSYNPYPKLLASDYNIPYVLKLVVTPKVPKPYINKSLPHYAQARDVVEAMREVFLKRPWENDLVLDMHATKLADGWNRGDHNSTKQFYGGWKDEIRQRVQDGQF